jgi:hypothetical protein
MPARPLPRNGSQGYPQTSPAQGLLEGPEEHPAGLFWAPGASPAPSPPGHSMDTRCSQSPANRHAGPQHTREFICKPEATRELYDIRSVDRRSSAISPGSSRAASAVSTRCSASGASEALLEAAEGAAAEVLAARNFA